MDEASVQESPMLTIHSIGYRAQCSVAGCGNLAQTIFRYADRGGRPLSNLERCNRHAREALERDREAGIVIYDERGPRDA
jgi:hypothetical protein